AFVHGFATNTETTAVEIMKENIDIIRDGFINNTTPCGIPFINSGKIDNRVNTNITPKIYPNPANNFITIKGNSTTPCSIEILDLKGSTLISKNMHNGTNQLDIDISNLPEAVYFIKIKQNNSVTTKKLVVIR
ncbi:MAG: T9SS type A sorting domain-containing protein, partial [Bacteroidales bacterium]|nr:T9SS type A sorting domain-containing protein [Bacteroidales bacterium]